MKNLLYLCGMIACMTSCSDDDLHILPADCDGSSVTFVNHTDRVIDAIYIVDQHTYPLGLGAVSDALCLEGPVYGFSDYDPLFTFRLVSGSDTISSAACYGFCGTGMIALSERDWTLSLDEIRPVEYDGSKGEYYIVFEVMD